ncbi:hypothetical protein [Mycolicibacterium psychrotolerans]|uniref:DUF4386 domain-containing protein n=1 Tax=Mycolicibacterium psychrotolerans TaxID=216929 RepID=A0A7I7M463_9MYCO|nr:hypothetical protein [Mycolicibacterium psychrotolerans]BBX66961.1 hypothetical protein MPSYJ_04220 [Mycolicibacterium psychrotolerans]
MTHPTGRQLRSLTTPRAAALAGVAFALLFGVVLVVMRTSLPPGAQLGSQWSDGSSGRLKLAIVLTPFAGIAFLWFIGVLRDGLGQLEDQFFTTVFIGSGFLFLAMIFTSTAVGAGLLASKQFVAEAGTRTEVAAFGQGLLLALTDTYALRMAAVFMMSVATIWLRTGLMPRWLVVVTYLVAIAVLVASDVSPWTTVAFPVWVLLVSLLLLFAPAASTRLPDRA